MLSDEDKQWMREAMREATDASEGRVREQIYNLETKLLTEFHKWASPLETRVRSHSMVLRLLDEEQEYMRDPLKKLEEWRNGKTGI